MMERIVEANNTKLLIKEFKRIIFLAYGVKSEDGKRFIKSDEIREEFSQTAAYSELFMQLALDADVLHTALPLQTMGNKQMKNKYGWDAQAYYVVCYCEYYSVVSIVDYY